MRLRGIYALLALGATVAAMLVVAGPAAAANYPCGTVFTAAGTYPIFGNQSVNGTCYTIAHDNVTLAFQPGNSTITETNANWNVIVDKGYSGFTIQNGKIVGGNVQIVIKDAADSNVINMVLEPNPDSLQSPADNGGHYGVGLDNTTDTLIQGNTISGDGYGVYLNSFNHDTGNTTDVITGNTISDSGTDGIFLDFSAGIVISGNTITGSDNYGIESDSESAGLAINGNVLDTNGTGMYFDSNSGNQVVNNYVQNSVGVINNNPGSYGSGVEDYGGDLNSYVGNVLNENVGTGFYIFAMGDGPVTMVNNTSNTSQEGDGFRISEAYNSHAYGGPFTLVSGNVALGNTGFGFVDFGHDYRHDFFCGEAPAGLGGIVAQSIEPCLYSTNETWTQNSGWYNAEGGFVFHYPTHYAITHNSGSYNHGDGFRFEDVSSPFAPASFGMNAAYYNDGTGFYSHAPLPGSGNTGGGTNGEVDCYLVAGCS